MIAYTYLFWSPLKIWISNQFFKRLNLGCPKNSKHCIFDPTRTFRILRISDLNIFKLWISVFDLIWFELRIFLNIWNIFGLPVWSMHFSLSIAQNMREKFESVSLKTILNESNALSFYRFNTDLDQDSSYTSTLNKHQILKFLCINHDFNNKIALYTVKKKCL